jgi:hypothetical protein
LEWEGHYIDILKGDQFSLKYQKLNPRAVVPTLVQIHFAAARAKLADTLGLPRTVKNSEWF